MRDFLVKPNLYVNVSCKTNRDCLKEVGDESQCINNICKCGPDNGQCDFTRLIDIDNILTSSELGGHCNDSSNCIVDHSKCDQQQNICVCKDDLLPSEYRNLCLKPLKSFQDQCGEDGQCSLLVPSSRCDNYKCVCQKNHTFADSNCWAMIGLKIFMMFRKRDFFKIITSLFSKLGLNQYCSSTHQCSHIRNSECVANKCSCSSNYTADSNSTRCLPVASSLNSACYEHIQCTKGLGDGSNCNRHFCECSDQFYFNSTAKKCDSNFLINQKCYLDEDCYHLRTRNDQIYCSKNQTCRCRPGFIELNNICKFQISC